MDVHARVSILNHGDLVMDRSKTVRYSREIPYRNARAISPVKQPGPNCSCQDAGADRMHFDISPG
jgi:hypothetical protein